MARDLRDAKGFSDNFSIAVRLGDEVISGKDGEQGIAFRCVSNMNGCQSDGRRRVSADGFDENALAGNSRKLFAESSGLRDIRDRPNAVRGKERVQPCDGLLQHCGFAGDVEELLWRAHSAAGPEARATSSG